MTNILKNPSFSAANGYNGFDMSKYLKFSSSVGHILPVYYDILQPGDKITAKSTLKTRTMVLDSAAMVQIEEHLDWFFVPMEQLYHFFNEFYYGVQDFRTDFVANASPLSQYYPYFKYADLISFLQNNSGNNSTYFSNISDNCEILRLLDLLGFPVEKIHSSLYHGSSPVNYSLIPVLLQAYQKIYFDYYRLDDRESNDPVAYNVDSYLGGVITPDNPYFTLRYIPWKKDFYTNNFISPIFTDEANASSLGIQTNQVNNWLGGIIGFTTNNDYGNVSTNLRPATSVAISNQDMSSGTAMINAANIRSMFAVDKLLEITRRAGKHYDKQTLAHFGVDVPTGISGEVFALHSSQSEINIGDVIATGNGSVGNASSVLGQVGGKGFGLGVDNGFQFEAPSHGVLMCVYYGRPIVDYLPSGVDSLNIKVNSYDWFKPEFDNLGMQPLFAAQTNFSEDSQNNSNTSIVGWQYRYNEYKNKPNTVNGALAHDPNFQIWTTSKRPAGNNLVNYLVDPSFLNNIMSVNYAPSYDESVDQLYTIWQTDPLLHQIYFDVKKASKMSTYGLPSL